MLDQSDRTLVLFFTFGVSLETWKRTGAIDREVALYEAFGEEYDRIYLLTYGGDTDETLGVNLPTHIRVVPKRVISNDFLYSLLLPFLHRDVIAQADLLKTNQMLGAWSAVIASVLYRIPLLVRTGYVLSIFYERKGQPWPLRFLSRCLERVAYLAADGVITSSKVGYKYVEARYSPSGDHLMLPNYIETDVFLPMNVDKTPNSICFVGRLAPQKNLQVLLTALEGLRCQLTVVGSGPLEEVLINQAECLDMDVEFLDNVPNHDLPELLNRHEVFVLPSQYEGMPKTLLEAMSCGLAVVGTDVIGIREVIEDGETGLLCDTDSGSIRGTLERVLSDDQLRHKLGAKAREEIVETYSLPTILTQERELHRSLIAHAD